MPRTSISKRARGILVLGPQWVETRMFRNKLNMNNLRLSIVDVSPKSYKVRFLRIAKTQIAAKDEDQQNMDCGLYWNWQIQQRRHLSASLILTTLARQLFGTIQKNILEACLKVSIAFMRKMKSKCVGNKKSLRHQENDN